MRRYGGSTATTPSTTAPAPADAPASMLAHVGSGTLHVSQADVGAARERSQASPAAHAVPAAHGPGRVPVVPRSSAATASTSPTSRSRRSTRWCSSRACSSLALIGLLVGTTIGAGRSPARHLPARSRSTSRLDDVMGIDPVKEDVVRSLNLFLAHSTSPRRWAARRVEACSSRGCPAPARPTWPRRWPREAGVPFLFVSATSFQSMYYGATARKIRSYFKALRKAARQEGGAIGFIEEIDAIAMTRGGLSMRRRRPLGHARSGVHVLRRPRTAPPTAERAVPRHASRTARRPFDSARAPAASSTSCSSRCSPSTSRPGGRSSHDLVRRRGSTCCCPPHRQLHAAAAASRPTSCSSRRRTVPTTSTPRCCVRAASTAGSRSSRPAKAGAPRARRPLPGAARRTTPSSTTTTLRDRLAAGHPGLHAGDDRAPASTRPWSTRCAAATRAMTIGRHRAGPARPRRSASASRSQYTDHEQRADRHPRGRARRHGLARRAASAGSRC